jgi:hypothetical protein
MKPLLSIIALAAFIFVSCQKDEDTVQTDPVDTNTVDTTSVDTTTVDTDTVPELLSGTYIGPSFERSSYLQEVWTSPNEYHYEWVSDTVLQDFDTLRIRQVSVDSFVMEGPVGSRLSSWWDSFAWDELVDSSGIYTFEKEFGYSYGFFTARYSVVFNPNNQTVEVKYNHSTYNAGSLDFTFEGSK